ncbi:pyruvate, phosphate dikinase [Lacticaseibacillus chiayiensis]|uniref:Pyruvate, phosphate dikinase n=1 Tax=Lacticaseibacillus chiayiensis TaxID=2100821 RepID=A0A4V1P0L0_9LACO|nr:pyruvate, phosphate dikinase [Lacticaseibacillus chiayiensis]RXT20890.1 pyruvate, phosphate dikinase [Lacticaseibacillus chiayiensis]UYN55964.1 pyruvate, phosphate dikinase [Lacticaseibacillus chiayiensis]
MKQIYAFAEGNMEMRALLGGKGANLAEMTNLGLPVPPGFTMTTAACHDYQQQQGLSDALLAELDEHLQALEQATGKRFDDPTAPLLVSVRSGAPISMPGMMDTILNIGLNDQTVQALATLTADARFAYDSYRRLLAMFGNVVYGLSESAFDDVLTAIKREKGYTSDLALTTDDLQRVIEAFKQLYTDAGKSFPQSPKAQILAAIVAVFESWNNRRAVIYRRENHIPEDLGTAVNVQTMVFGNAGEDSGTGVAFTRDPATGERALFGEYLLNAQGEDVVSGVRTPQPVAVLHEQMPEVYDQLAAIATTLEQHYRDMQDLEFTIEHGELYLLQARNGKRTPAAAVKIAVDLVNEGLIDRQEALMRIEPKSLSDMLHPEFDSQALAAHEVLATGLPASPGAATGEVYFTAAEAKAAHEAGHQVILMRQDTSPEDIEGMIVSRAIVTARGGMTSHAAVVARGMGATGVVGVHALSVDEHAKTATVGDIVLHEGDWVSVDGTTGHLYRGRITTTAAMVKESLATLLDWAKAASRMGVYTNADTPKDLQQALAFGADGIGLTRTEHMFFQPERLLQMRRLILAKDAEGRKAPLAALEKMQEQDFYDLYRLAAGKSVTIRLLDPPLHEFLPHDLRETNEVANELGLEQNQLRERMAALKEVNPMLGHRGDRLAVTFPDIYVMQVRAMMHAVFRLADEGVTVTPHIMIPLTNSETELRWVRRLVSNEIEQMASAKGIQVTYEVGTMIETPRACVTADMIANAADFFSFGTNDLTQLTFGYSRDDVGSFLPDYLEKKILPADPFQTVDTEGVGALMKMAIDKGRATKAKLPIGVCGEVGGDPDSVAFFDSIGVSYVSCSPYRVPVARLAAAQATLRATKKAKARS